MISNFPESIKGYSPPTPVITSSQFSLPSHGYFANLVSIPKEPSQVLKESDK